MINFHKYGFLDAKRLKEYFKDYNFWLHRLNPIYLFIWSDLYKPEIAFTNDFIYIRYLDSKEGMCYYPPIGSGDMKMALYLIKEDAIKNGFELNISAIDDNLRNKLALYRINSYLNEAESSYIYTTKALSFTDRRLYKRQIKAMYAFRDLNPDTYFKLVKKEDFPMMLEFVNEWHSKGGIDSVSIYQRLNMLKKCMEHLYELDLVGVLLLDSEYIYGLAIGSVINSMAYLHCAITLKGDAGAYENLISAFSAAVSNRARYINLEEDYGNKEVKERLEGYKPYKRECLYSSFHLK